MPGQIALPENLPEPLPSQRRPNRSATSPKFGCGRCGCSVIELLVCYLSSKPSYSEALGNYNMHSEVLGTCAATRNATRLSCYMLNLLSSSCPVPCFLRPDSSLSICSNSNHMRTENTFCSEKMCTKSHDSVAVIISRDQSSDRSLLVIPSYPAIGHNQPYNRYSNL